MLSVFIILLLVQHGTSQKQGDLCVKESDNSLGVCVPASRCQSVKQDYLIKRIIPTFCERNQQTVVVCCSDDNSIHFSPTIQNSITNNGRPQPQANDNRRVSEKKCAEYGDSVIETIDGTDGVTTANCDYNKVHLIVGGEDAERGEFPHMTAIGWINLQGTYSFLCGGSLISSNFVLTAAHCSKYGKMRDPKPVIVRLGDQNINPEKDDGANPIDVKIKKIIKHPQYKSPGKYHDIALLELASNVEFQSSIRPACLWNKPGFSDYTQAVATGWGVVDPRTERTSDELKKVSLTLIENNYCDFLLKKKRNRNWAVGFTDNQLCAGELRGGKDTCQGDSGSPLQVVSRENKCLFHLIGITSFGDKCAQSGSPAVYTRVYSYLDWIESVVWPGES